VVHFGVELHSVKPPGRVPDRPAGAGVTVADHFEARRQAFHPVAVAHPHLLLLAHTIKQVFEIGDGKGFMAVFPADGRGHLAAQEMVQELDAVADAQDRHPESEELRVDAGGIPVVDAAGPPRQDDALGRKLFDAIKGHDVGVDFAVDFQLPDPAGNELGVLGAEVQDEHFLLMRIEHVLWRWGRRACGRSRPLPSTP
jgi:hypothetical protein